MIRYRDQYARTRQAGIRGHCCITLLDPFKAIIMGDKSTGNSKVIINVSIDSRTQECSKTTSVQVAGPQHISTSPDVKSNIASGALLPIKQPNGSLLRGRMVKLIRLLTGRARLLH